MGQVKSDQSDDTSRGGGSGSMLLGKMFEFRVSEMAFPADFEDTFEQILKSLNHVFFVVWYSETPLIRPSWG